MQAQVNSIEGDILDEAEAASLVGDRAADPRRRLQAARSLLVHGHDESTLAAVADIAPDRALAGELRKLQLYAGYVARATRLLDFAGSRGPAGAWEALDGTAPGTGTRGNRALIWARPGAHRVVAAFSNIHGGFGPAYGWPSLALLHRELAPLPVSVVYLLDRDASLHFGGIEGLGKDYGACLRALAALFAARGWREAYALGVSAGGFSALRYALDLGCKAVLSMSGPTSMEPDERASGKLRGFYRRLRPFAVDLLPLYQASEARPRMLLCYGALNSEDRRLAERMSSLPEAELVPFPGLAGHSTFTEAMRTRALPGLLARLLHAG